MEMPKNSDKSHSHDLWQFRSTVEGIYIAIILAFVLRAFMIEAFVIPTGSMANALYGEHYRLQCPACGYEYAYGYFPGDNDTGQHGVSVPLGKARAPRNAVCPNCGYHYAFDELKADKVHGSGGDRVVVMKYLYEFAGPEPWDVVVFKNPQNNRENYIKRLVGLPGETLEIVLGDVFVKQKGSSGFHIRRKPEYAQSDMWLVVYDNDFLPAGSLAEFISQKPQWVSKEKSGGVKTENQRVFHFDGIGNHGIVFRPGDKNAELGPLRPTNGYNPPQAEQMTVSPQLDVCTDWKLSAVILGDGANSGRVQFDFELRGRKYRATFDLAGKVELAMGLRSRKDDDGGWLVDKTVQQEFLADKGRQVELRHIDMMTSLWVDGKEILAVDDTLAVNTADGRTVAPCGYDTAKQLAAMPELLRQTSADIARLQTAGKPAQLHAAREKFDSLKQRWDWYQNPSISITGSGKFSLAHVKILRDVYYTSPRIFTPRDNNANYDYVRKMLEQGGRGPNSWKRDEDGNFIGWGVTGNPITLREFPDDSGRNEYYCLGDNSSQSFDCRSWIAAAPTLKLMDKKGDFGYQLGTVPRYNIIGRAFFVFWPAGFTLPVLEMPVVPNAGRM
ncbi:MAG TPA: S26 family signal peptidase, partial [Phycisphaerae bacterium]|nr:S26 family signal peptidase [Phycisphaerae bacterium]